MLSIEHVSIEFSANPILNDITFLINKKDRVALVGKNGAGKTTLLRLIAVEYQPTEGHIARDNGLTIGYLPQVMLHKDGKTLREEVMEVFTGEDEARFVAEMDKTIIGLGFERTDSVNELAQWYSTADVFVNTTYEDNYPTVNLESQACGTPAITYKTGGSVESVPQNNIVEQGNINSLVLKIKEVCSSKVQLFKPFGISDMVEKYIDLYMEDGK